MAGGGVEAPRQITWIVCLVLNLVALLSQFGYLQPGREVALWSWVFGYGLVAPGRADP